ncbi:MAG: peptidylprolyl isomerase [Pirellulales bacterium]
MSYRTRSSILFSCLFALTVTSVGFCQEPAPVIKADAANGQFEQLLTKWKIELAGLRDLQEKFRNAKGEELEAINKQYNSQLKTALALLPELRKAAVSAYLASPNTNQEVTTLLMKMISDDVQNDRYEGVYALSKMFIDNKSGAPGMYAIAINAAYGLDKFEEIAALKSQGIAAKEQLSQEALYTASAAKQLAIDYQAELAIRKKEAQANDLPLVKMETSKGTVVIELFENEAPGAVGNFVSLVEKGYYNGLTFHRVLPGFMAQGGCPDGTGSGGPGYNIFCECDKPNFRHHFRGTLSMAHAGKNTGGSQFFLTFKATTHLDGKHTAFGRVVEGLDVLAELQRIDPSSPAPGVAPDKIVKAEVIRKRNHAYEPKKTR